MLRIKLISLILCMLVLSSCATKVESIDQESEVALQEKQGYLLLAVDTNRSLQEIILTGTKRIALSEKDLKSGSNYILVPLPVGQYEISKVTFNNYAYLKDFEDDIWAFTVEENKINYAGHLKMNSYVVWYYVASRMSLNNNSSIALEFMEDKFSNILLNHPMTYSGPGEENFFELINSQPAKKDSE
ncbi:hypothetical protein RI845_02030 [Thalassotalea nanhaiensis]|uniref:DUF2846 domain-containing protein n=1 Tax=Thalassotalea nanhaiensis TaxID=3065648 RepID=A0ABY9TMG2_9GAMM|nr:hypothetical protein RI845_02030 [Colwelliaceae bacterium SQ345]